MPHSGHLVLGQGSTARTLTRTAGRAAQAVRPDAFQQQPHRNTADFDHGKALAKAILAALYVAGLVMLLIVLLSANTATGQLVWGLTLGVAALPLLYWIGKVVVALIRPARNTRRQRSLQPFSPIATRHLQRRPQYDGNEDVVLIILVLVLAALGLLSLLLGAIISSAGVALLGLGLLAAGVLIILINDR